MLTCWKEKPIDRPTFQNLAEILADMLRANEYTDVI